MTTAASPAGAVAPNEAIRCEGLTKHFGRFVALDGLNLSIEHGTIFGFLGPNGAGKTTTLRLLAGLTHPTAGRVWVAGREVSGNSLELRAAIGYLPEAPAYYPWMTGREFLWFTAELYGVDHATARTRAEELLRRVGLEGAAHRRIKGYSRGMQQRLGLAQALMNEPRVLLLDEPASALDPMGRKDMLETIRSLRGQTTVFISTHILSDVERLCDRIAIIDKGKLVTAGGIDEVRSHGGVATFEVECEEDPAELSQRLAGLPWVQSTRVVRRLERYVLQVNARDVGVGKKQLLRAVADSGVTVVRYELVSASLEEAFIELVGKKEVRA